jgi:hypothetical protein
MRSNAKDVGIGKAVPLAHCENLVPLAKTGPGPADRGLQASSLMVLRGELTPQPLTTISNSKAAGIYREGVNHALRTPA